MKTILHIDSSARTDVSVSRKLSQAVVDQLSDNETQVIYRDLNSTLPFVNDLMVEAYNTPPEQRTDTHKECLSVSDELVQELKNADILVIGAPMYNFSAPASLKAWADLVARAGETFRYTEHAPVGLLENKKAYIVTITGGAPLNSPVDFLTPWLRQFVQFLGISDMQFIAAEGFKKDPDGPLNAALSQIKALS